MPLDHGIHQLPFMPNGKAMQYYRFRGAVQQSFIPNNCCLAMIATVNREKSPKMKWRRTFRAIALNRSGNPVQVAPFCSVAKKTPIPVEDQMSNPDSFYDCPATVARIGQSGRPAGLFFTGVFMNIRTVAFVGLLAAMGLAGFNTAIADESPATVASITAK